jgi:hypothetical protein
MVVNMANTKSSNGNVIEQYFEGQNEKFFAAGGMNGKKAFFCLGLYCRKVMENLEKTVAESGTQKPK